MMFIRIVLGILSLSFFPRAPFSAFPIPLGFLPSHSRPAPSGNYARIKEKE